VHCLINFDNLWEIRKAVSIRDICPVSLIPSVFLQAVSAIQAHMVIYNSRDSTPKINCYWQTFTYQRMRRGCWDDSSYLLLLTFKTNFSFPVYTEIFVSFPNDSSLLYFINYGSEGGTDSEHTIIWHCAFDRCMLLRIFASSVWTEIAVNALAAGLEMNG